MKDPRCSRRGSSAATSNRRRALCASALGLALLTGVAQPALAQAGSIRPATMATVEPAHFHHVHLNVTDVPETMQWYEKFFGANRVQYRDRVDALFTEKSFLLFNVVGTPPRDNFGTTFWHIGWAGVDGHSEFEWRTAEGIEVQTPLTPLGNNYYMYFWGPDRELVEVYTGSKNHRFEHVHVLPVDIEETLAWFDRYLGLKPTRPVRTREGSQMRVSTIRVDNVNLIMFEVPPPGTPQSERNALLPAAVGPDFEPTEGRAMDHIAFSYADIDPVYQRMVADGVEVVHPIRTHPELGFRSFFVRGTDGLLVEIVEEKPVPEGIWR